MPTGRGSGAADAADADAADADAADTAGPDADAADTAGPDTARAGSLDPGRHDQQRHLRARGVPRREQQVGGSGGSPEPLEHLG